MAPRANLMNPRMEHLLDRVDSKFTLVTLSAMRAREINDYYNQLGEGLGKIVPPQVTSVSRKPLSIALEEIEVGKIESDPAPHRGGARGRALRPRSAAAAAAAAAARRGVSARLAMLTNRRIVLGVSGGIAAYKAVEVCRRLVDAGAHVAPVLTEDALRFVGALTFSALASEPARTSLFDGPEPDPAHPPRPDRRPRDRRAGHRQAARQVRRRHLRRPAHRHAARHPGAGARRAGDAHRDVGAPRGPGEPRHAARAGACTSSIPSPGGSPAATSARVAWPIPPTSWPRPTPCWRPRGRRRPRRGAGPGHRRRHPRADRRGPDHHQPVVGQAGLRDRRGRRPPRCRRHPRHHHRPARAAGRRDRAGADRGGDAGRRARPGAGHRRDRDGGGGRRLPAQGTAEPRSSRSTRASPRSCSSPPTTSSSTSGARRRPVRCSWGSRPRPTTWSRTRRASCAAKRLDLIVGNDVSQPDAGFEVDTNRAVLLDADGGIDTLPLLAKSDLAGVILDKVARLLEQKLARESTS